MANTPHPLADDQLDDLLQATAARIDISPMSDAAALARSRIEARAGQTTASERPDNLIPLPTDDRVQAAPPDSEPERLGREPRSRLRDYALLGGGLAAAAVIAVALAFVFRGFDGASEDEPGPSLVGVPLAAEPYDIPGYEFVATAGQPQVPNEPVDVAIGPDGTQYVLDAGLQRVIAFTPDGEVHTDWGDEGFSARIPERFSISIGVGPDGEIYVTSEHQVIVFDATGEQADSWALPESADDKTRSPLSQGLVVDSDGNVYVAGVGVIWRFEAGTGAATTIELESQTDIQLQIDNHSQLYAASRQGGIYRVSTDSKLELVGRTSGQDDINGFAVAPDGTFVVFQSSTSSGEPSTFIILDRDGSELASWPIGRAGFFMGNSGPYWIGVTVTPDGTIALPDPLGHRVTFYDYDGALVSEIRDERPDAFGRLWRIGVDGDGNVLGFDPSVNSKVLRFSPNGKLLQSAPFVSDLIGSVDSLFKASGFAATEDGGFIVANKSFNLVSTYAPDGKLERQWEQWDLPSEEGLVFPRAIALDPEGFVYILDQGRVTNLKKFTLEGEYVESIGNRLAAWVDLAYHDGALWMVADGAILRFPGDGGVPQPIAAASTDVHGGNLPGYPLSLALDADGNIYTYMLPVDAGQGNTTGSLAKLDPNGNVIWTGEVAGGILDRYVDLAIAPDGTLYLADSELRQILVYRSVAEN